ncbi:MAG: response regulator transcription factor [Clostridia bacterium]|nr:response regulator transcription factor [Clostridia bacterium]
MKILLAEDEDDLARVQKAMLEHSGYSVDRAANGREAVTLAEKNAYDAMVMDVMMPVMDGVTALKTMRSSGITTPALLLTAKSQIEDRVAGLDAGADDYLTKPFAFPELLARIRSMTRRRTDYTKTRYEIGNLTLDVEAGDLAAVNSISLSSRETRLMEHFMQNPSKPFSTEDIFRRVWSDDPSAGAEVVWVYISFLRGKLKSIGASCRIEGEKGGDFYLKDE